MKQAGNHLDLLVWDDPMAIKPMDADKDKRYGSAGYCFPAARRLDARSILVLDDSIDNPPEFIGSFRVSGD